MAPVRVIAQDSSVKIIEHTDASEHTDARKTLAGRLTSEVMRAHCVVEKGKDPAVAALNDFYWWDDVHSKISMCTRAPCQLPTRTPQ